MANTRQSIIFDTFLDDIADLLVDWYGHSHNVPTRIKEYLDTVKYEEVESLDEVIKTIERLAV